MRAIRVLPMFLLLVLSSAAYSTFVSYISFSAPVHDTVYNCLEERSGCDRKDQKILEKLRAERQAKIDELKEKTNYYTTQQLIQGLSFRLMGLVCSTVKAVKNKNMACAGNLMKMKSFVNRKVGCYSNPRSIGNGKKQKEQDSRSSRELEVTTTSTRRGKLY
ncbi:hypothetical protein RIF29_15290 [Crotalaria pallida]|uniref:Uncharacterized protein n=1 Tax=Crotalaria pallida TaxID=3830 RepID=A0AAN9IDG5_CROPI